MLFSLMHINSKKILLFIMSAATAAKGYRFARTGNLVNVVSLKEFQATPGTAADDVVVKMSHVPLHRSDAGRVNGSAFGAWGPARWSATKTPDERRLAPPAQENAELAAPRTVGWEGVGVLQDTAVATSRGGWNPGSLQVGDSVWVSPSAGTVVGTWASHCIAPASHCHKLPKDCKPDFVGPIAGTAVAASRLVQLAISEAGGGKPAILVSGGSGLLALLATFIASKQGASVIAAAAPGPRFAAAKARLTAAGAKNVVEYNAKGAMQVKCVDAFLSGAGGRPFDAFTDLSMKEKGHIIHYGAGSSGPGLTFSTGPHIKRSLTTRGFFLPRYLAQLTYEERQTAFETAIAAVKDAPAYPLATCDLESLPTEWDKSFINGGSKAVLVMKYDK